MWRTAAYSISILLVTGCPALAVNTIDTGQYALGAVQQMCLTDHGTWYGTTFNFTGRYSPQGVAGHMISAMVGNYLVHSTAGTEKANVTISILQSGEAYWYDWFDDLGYSKFVITGFQFVKRQCDPPFTRRNKAAASEGLTPASRTAPSVFKSGQYQLGDPMIQEICLKDDGSWYGTTFNFSGGWIRFDVRHRPDATIFGNYAVPGHKYTGFANDTITIGKFTKNHEPVSADWYDWYDNGYFENVFNTSVTFVKTDCDPPFTGENTHAATQ